MITAPTEKLEAVANGFNRLQSQIQSINDEIEALLAMGIIKANVHMRDGWYMYLLHPTKQGEKRIRKYVGANKANQKAALEKIKRAHRVQQLIRQREAIENRIRETDEALTKISNWLN